MLRQIFRKTPSLALLLLGTAAVSHGAETVPAPVAPPPARLDATVTLTGGVVAAGVGYQWGHGILTYQGRRFDFCAKGLSVGDVGVADLTARGAIYNLESLDDFPGRYFALSGGFAVARGESASILKNRRGVMMEVEVQEIGLRLNLAASGLNITMAGHHGCKAPKPAAKAAPAMSRGLP